MKLDVAERLPGAGQRHFLLGRAVGVVERGLRRAALGDSAQVLDGQRRLEPALPSRFSGACWNCISGASRVAWARVASSGSAQSPAAASARRTSAASLFDEAADLLQQQRLSLHQLFDVLASTCNDGDFVERIRARRRPARGSARSARGSHPRPGCAPAPAHRPRRLAISRTRPLTMNVIRLGT